MQLRVEGVDGGQLMIDLLLTTRRSYWRRPKQDYRTIVLGTGHVGRSLLSALVGFKRVRPPWYVPRAIICEPAPQLCIVAWTSCANVPSGSNNNVFEVGVYKVP